MHHPPSRPHRASRRLPPQALLAIVPPAPVLPAPVALPAGAADMVEASPRLVHWLRARKLCLALSTGESGKLLTLGAGPAGLTVFDVSCEIPGALLLTEKGLHVAAHRRLWRFDDALGDGERYRGTDRLCLPSQCRPTGAIGIQDLAVLESGKLLAAASAFNSVVRINSRGDLKPVWRPAFIDKVVREDRCHLTGFCLRDDAVAYVTVTAASNVKDGWQQAQNGGQVIDAVTQRAVAEGLDRPTAPRLTRNRLWVLESGSGWLGRVDLEKRAFERFVQLPGTPRGLRFVGNHALVMTSGEGAGIHWVNLKTGKTDHRLSLRGSIADAIDVAFIPGETVPRLAGLSFADSGLEEPQRIAG
ncbi:DUF4915 domain-containing protein [Dongia sp.]|uniref:DUF4915 domain-containing protein n=1 Tax=Dongia sp. TaxID=1977262 RepID=UPI00375397BC